MKIKWLHIVRDSFIVNIMLFIGSYTGRYIGSIVSREIPTNWSISRGLPINWPEVVSVLLMSTLLVTVGFCISGCLTIKNRWKHLFLVALVVWLFHFLPNLLFRPFNVLSFASSITSIVVTMVIGGVLSSILARSPNHK